MITNPTGPHLFRIVVPVLAMATLVACGGSDSSSGNGGSPAAPTPVPSPAPTAAPVANACIVGAARGARDCVRMLNDATRRCYLEDGAACSDTNPDAAAALAAVEDAVGMGCADSTAISDAGFGRLFTPATLTARIQNVCVAEVAALAARAFGGPHGAVIAAANEDTRACLGAAHEAASAAMDAAIGERDACLADESTGVGCDSDAANAAIEQIGSTALAAVDAACEDLSAAVAVKNGTFVDRALAQTECLAAAAHGETSPFVLGCGPRDAVEALPRGEYVQVVLDEATWGTRCGDGSPFAFWVRLAPEGAPVENVVVGMEGGGVCVFEEDCASRPPGLFEALQGGPPTTGPMSNDPEQSALANYTKVYVPYCNQDVFAGGGATSNFDSITVHRFGALNVRAAMRWLRDAVWRELDALTAEGYSPQAMRVYFGGWSAGGFGTLYNFHYLLDDLQWERSVAFPDAALALNSGGALSVAGLGGILIADGPPIGWDSLEQLPSYCFQPPCAVGPNILHATAPRLLEVPEQRFMILTNQNDNVQVATTFFPSTEAWINEARASYCDTRDLPGVAYYMPAFAESIHVISLDPSLYRGITVDGQKMQEWLEQAMLEPTGVVSRVEEGNLVEALPGVEPFQCEVAP